MLAKGGWPRMPHPYDAPHEDQADLLFEEDAEVLPGELPPLRPRRRRKRPGRPRLLRRVLLILLACVLLLFLWLNRENLKPENFPTWIQSLLTGAQTGEGFPLDLHGETVQPENFRSSGQNLCLTGSTSILSVNGTAAQLYSRKHSYAQPVMKPNGSRVLVYSLGGTGYRMEGAQKTLAAADADGKILDAALADNGAYALLTQQEGYCGKLTCYQKDNRVAFRYWFSEYYPTAVALDPDGSHAVVAATGTQGGALCSVLYVLNLDSGKAAKPVATFPNTLLRELSYSGDGSIMAVGESALFALQENGQLTGTYAYNGALAAWELQAGRAVLAIGDFRAAENARLVSVDSRGKALTTVTLKGKVSSVSLFGGTMAALCEGKVQAFSAAGGTAVGACSAGDDARAIALRSESQAYILGVSEVRLGTLA